MIKELRIGNWVKAPLGEWMQVKQLGHKDNPEYIFAEGPEGFGMNGFEPIPLTPELLERLGFRWETSLKKHLQLYLPDQGINARYLTFFYRDGKCEMLQFYMDAYFDGYFETKPPEYLHQLQNLFFALTSTELEINTI